MVNMRCSCRQTFAVQDLPIIRPISAYHPSFPLFCLLYLPYSQWPFTTFIASVFALIRTPICGVIIEQHTQEKIYPRVDVQNIRLPHSRIIAEEVTAGWLSQSYEPSCEVHHGRCSTRQDPALRVTSGFKPPSTLFSDCLRNRKGPYHSISHSIWFTSWLLLFSQAQDSSPSKAWSPLIDPKCNEVVSDHFGSFHKMSLYQGKKLPNAPAQGTDTLQSLDSGSDSQGCAFTTPDQSKLTRAWQQSSLHLQQMVSVSTSSLQPSSVIYLLRCGPSTHSSSHFDLSFFVITLLSVFQNQLLIFITFVGWRKIEPLFLHCKPRSSPPQWVAS